MEKKSTVGKQAGNSSKGDSKRLCIVFTGIAGGIAEETQVLDVSHRGPAGGERLRSLSQQWI